MKKLLLLIVFIFFNSSILAKEVEGDLYDYLDQGYKIINVTTTTRDNAFAIIYMLSKKDKHFVNCLYNINGKPYKCWELDKH